MFNVRLKYARCATKSVLTVSLVLLILLNATASARVLRRNGREIIDSDSGHVNGGSILPAVAPTSSETTGDDVPIDRAHSLELNNKTNGNHDERVGTVVDISNTNSSTNSKYSQNDIITSNLNGSTTSPSTTMLPSSSTDVNNAIATDALDESHPNYQHEHDGTKHNQRTTPAPTRITTIEAPIASSTSMTPVTPAAASTESHRAAHRSKDEPRVAHETHENVTDKRAKFLADNSADQAAASTPSWADLKNVGEVNHNNVTFSKATEADSAVVNSETKATQGHIVPSTNIENSSTESMGNAGGVVVEHQRHMFDLKLNRNSSQIDDAVHQDISINVLPTATSTSSTTMSPATTTTSSTTPRAIVMPHTTESEGMMPRFHDEIELHLLSTTTEDQLTTTTEQPPYDTTLVDESIATINTLKPNEPRQKLLPIVEESTKIIESFPDSTISITTLKPNELNDQSTVERETEHATEPITEMATTFASMVPTMRTSTMPSRFSTSIPTTEAGVRRNPDRHTGNQVEKESENSINAEERVTHRTADVKSTTVVGATTRYQVPTISLFVPTTDASTTSTSTVMMRTMMTTTTMASTSSSSSTTSTTTSTTSTTTESTLPEETSDQPGIGDELHPEAETPDVNAMIAITISIVSVVTLILLVGFLIVMRKRQKQLSYAQRCRPLGLDDAYSLDNISVYNSVRRKSTMRTSKRAYGNAAFDDPALKNNLLTIAQLAAFVQRRASIYEEFRDVPLVTARIDEVPTGCEDKNRYANVVPLPESRVHLQQLDDDETTEYINANYVKGPKDTSHYYIACQAPMDNTILDFWRMIWEQNSRVIIMATDLTENGIEKCAEYLPPSFVVDNHVTFGDFTITLKNREVRDKYAVSTMHLKNMQTKTWREVTHLWYQWPETGTPSDETSVIAMLLEARSYLKMAAPEQKAATGADDDKLKSDDLDMKIANGNSEKSKSLPRVQGPLTVHCSPGTGRTGTIIACDIAIRTLEQPTRSVDIPQIVYCVRRGRASAVQTREQYEFIYKVTQMYATKLTGLHNEN